MFRRSPPGGKGLVADPLAGKYKPPGAVGVPAMEYHDSPEAVALAERASEFVEEVVMPRERELAPAV
jgi:hypothetical protein